MVICMFHTISFWNIRRDDKKEIKTDNLPVISFDANKPKTNEVSWLIKKNNKVSCRKDKDNESGYSNAVYSTQKVIMILDRVIDSGYFPEIFSFNSLFQLIALMKILERIVT